MFRIAALLMLSAGEEWPKQVMHPKRNCVLPAGPRPDAAFTISPAETGLTAVAMGGLTGRDAGHPAPPWGCSVTEGNRGLICKTIKK